MGNIGKSARALFARHEPTVGAADGRAASPFAGLLGAALLVAVLYALSGPGRVDMIDGQHRFDVALNILRGNGPVVSDPALIEQASMHPSASGKFYSDYAPGGSLLALPLLLLSELFGGSLSTMLFCFSLTSAFYAGVTTWAFGAILHLHGLSRRSVLISIGLLAVASPMWIMGTTVFHQIQFTSFIMLGLWASFNAVRRDSSGWAAAAGFLGGFSILAQESAALLVPWLAMPLWLAPMPRRRRIQFVITCALAASFWLGALLLSNQLRFGSALHPEKLQNAAHPPVWGSPFLGFEILTFSMGKSWLLFAPTYGLALLAARHAWRDARPLMLTVLGLTLTQYLFTSCLTFCAGDWAWGPRYLLAMAPVMSLPLAWLLEPRRWRRLSAAIFALSFAVQLLSVSVDHMRFFLEHRLRKFFWYDNPSVYFEESQLFSRLDELMHLKLEPVDPALVAFRPGPYPWLSTYASFGVPRAKMAKYPVFYLPRPWPLWSHYVPEGFRPTDTLVAGSLMLVVALVGTRLVVRSSRHWGGDGLVPSGAVATSASTGWLGAVARRPLKSKVLGRFARFVTTGGVSFLANLGILWVGTELLKLHYVLSMLLSALIVNVMGFVLNRNWTFQATTNPFLGDARRYLVVNAAAIIAAMAITGILVEAMHVPYLIANTLAAALLLCGNFAVHSSWTFRPR